MVFITAVLGRPRSKDGGFEVSMGYTMRLCLKSNNKPISKTPRLKQKEQDHEQRTQGESDHSKCRVGRSRD